MTNQNETRDVKKALKAQGYDVRVRRGTGTAWGWINVYISGIWTDKEWRDVQQPRIYGITKIAAGRQDRHDDLQTDYFCENILIHYNQRMPTAEEYAAMGPAALKDRQAEARETLAYIEGIGITNWHRADFMNADLANCSRALGQEA